MLKPRASSLGAMELEPVPAHQPDAKAVVVKVAVLRVAVDLPAAQEEIVLPSSLERLDKEAYLNH
jgi:hypothetical protein